MDASVIEFLSGGLASALQPVNLLVMVAGLAFGIIGGMLPGITVVTAIALAIPFTFGLPSDTALIALGAIFCGSTYGGANAAILMNTPGQPGSVATAFDGYQMTRSGRAQQAMLSALYASAVGGLIGVFILLLFFAPLSKIALKFGPAAFFWLAIFGLTTLAAMSPGNVLKGLLGGAIGLAISTVGLDPITGSPRFTFGYNPLIQGLDMVVVMIGIFSFSQMLVLLESRETHIAEYVRRPGVAREVCGYLVRKCKRVILQSSLLGTFIGTLPGAGGSVASIIAYNEAKRWDRDPTRYGTGIVEGVAAPESANNAGVGGSLVPLMSLGIPGNAGAAVLMGGLLAQGLTPGPQLLETHGGVAYTFITGLIVINIVMVPIGALIASLSAHALRIPKRYIVPTVIVLAVVGSYALRNNELDVVIMMASGVIAYLLIRVEIHPGPIALGLVLGPVVEEALSVSLRLARARDSVLDVLVFDPLAGFLIACCVLALVVPLWLERKKSTT
ncbi:MAG: tripartite tricarboxylate transporter permease [Alphaproteobacteria bacterium]|nr:tripartite tricarboxylate transporter permease [Alphaproteobacteria bacterium]